MDCKKTWSVVSFIDDKTVEAVPSNWIKGQLCYWPPLTGEKLMSAIRACEMLNTSWPSHRVKLFNHAIFDSYAKARQKSKIAEETSDLSTDTEAINKRKRIQRVLSSDGASGSSSENETFSIRTPPKLDKAKQRESRQEEASSLTNKNVASGSQALVSATLDLPSSSNECLRCKENDKKFKGIHEQLHIIRSICTDVLSEVQSLKVQNNKETVVKESFFNKYDINYPISTEDDLMKLEEILDKTAEFQDLGLELSKIGGSNCYNFIKRVMSTIITNDFALLYSWLGRKGKRPFYTLKLAKAVLYAAEHAKDVSWDRKEVETCVQLWLRRASDRKNTKINKPKEINN
ncbi:unnamed protein product [Callosobruchus maculatus]|uniref:DUF4806 domain-containing protein n=1 Tax=Callosobruchus maculatus TaxID=64391 RepID=A0A653BXJ7_CALMS|nr:unnamed protein product [Callosobruchus maculatus]